MTQRSDSQPNYSTSVLEINSQVYLRHSGIPVRIVDVCRGQALVESLDGSLIGQVWLGGFGFSATNWRWVDLSELEA